MTPELRFFLQEGQNEKLTYSLMMRVCGKSEKKKKKKVVSGTRKNMDGEKTENLVGTRVQK